MFNLSGLGFSLAQHTAECGFTVIATFLSLDSKGSKEIKHLYGGYIIQIQLDITDSSSIKNAVQTMEHYFSKNSDYSKFLVNLLTVWWVCGFRFSCPNK